MDEPKTNPALEALAKLKQQQSGQAPQQQAQPKPPQPQMQQPRQPQPQVSAPKPQVQSQPQQQAQLEQQQSPNQQKGYSVPNFDGLQKQPEPVYAPKKSRFGKLILVVILVIVLVSGGFAGVLASRIWDPIWSPFRPKPEEVLSKMITNMQAVKSIKADSQIKFSLNNEKSVDMVLKGLSDANDVTNPKIDFNIDLKIKGALSTSSVDSVKMRVISLDKSVYVNISDISVPSFEQYATMYGIDFSKIKGQWIKIPQNTSGTNSLSEQELSDLTKKVKDIYSKNNFYYVKQQLADENAGSVQVYHYLMSIDNQKFSNMIVDLMSEIIKQEAVKSQSQQNLGGVGSAMMGTDYIVAAAQAMIQKFLEKIGEINFDIKIGKSDYMLYGFSMKKNLDLSIFDPSTKDKASISMSANYSDFNSRVSVEAPANYQDAESVFPEIKKVKVKSDMDNLETKIYSLKSSEGSFIGATCQNESLKDLCAKIKTDSGSDVVINKSKTAYCLYVKLPGSSNSYYCTNNLLKSGEALNPGASGYCTKYTFNCPVPILNFGGGVMVPKY